MAINTFVEYSDGTRLHCSQWWIDFFLSTGWKRIVVSPALILIEPS